MPASKAQQKAVSKYMKENYDVFQIRMPKGKKADIQAAAVAVDESLNAYINTAIAQRMERDTSGGLSETAGACLRVGAYIPPTTIKVAREAAEAAGEELPVFVTRAVETQAQRDALSRRMKGGKANE